MQTNNNPTDRKPYLWHRANYLVFVLSSIMIISGFILMTGESTSEEAFCQDVFSWRRIVLAPILCLVGYLFMMVGIIVRKK